MLNNLRRVDPEIYEAVRNEVRRQHTQLELIASENYVSQAVLEAAGSVMTNKYAEGYPGNRYYGGCECVDVVERLAIERAKLVFGAEHANVQPHSGSQANAAVYQALMQPGEVMMGMDLACGGHLSHGSPVNFSGKLYRVVSYGVNPKTERIDFDQVRALAQEHRPKVIVAGYSAYPRTIQWEDFAEVARAVGAKLVVDIAHIAGLVAAKLHPDPVPCSEVVTTTTHKTMRGPRGGIILCKAELAKKIDSGVFPGQQGGPLMHVIAAKAVALREALEPGFLAYQKQILKNARALCERLQSHGHRMVTGGTDNHLFLMDLTPLGMTGKQAEKLLDEVGITVNKNVIPHDPRPPQQASGLRLGVPALTTRGMGEEEMKTIGDLINRTLRHAEDRDELRRVREETMDLCDQFPIYSGILRRIYEQDRGAYEVQSAY